MSGLDNILSKIIADAQGRSRRTLEDAQRAADQIILDASRQAEEEFALMLSKTNQQAETLVIRSHSAAILSTKRRLLEERVLIIDQVLTEIKADILALPVKEYFSIVASFVKAHAQNEAGTLVLSAQDLHRVPTGFIADLSDSLAGTLTMSPSVGNFDAGCVLIYGNIEYNGTLDALINEKRDELRDLLNKELFPLS